ncbi:MAG: Lrp/AsnC ligand binding domain-containing protein [Kineosporiaceae bacterium]
MITAIVLVETAVDRVPEVATALAELDGVSEVYSVTGDIDLVAIVRVKQHEDLEAVIADRLGKVDGVRGTRTYLAFRAYSRHDLEAAFSLGIEAP